MIPEEFEKVVEKNLVPSRFLLLGESDYLKNMFMRRLVERFLEVSLKPFNYDEFDGETVDDVDRLIMATLSIPNFSNFRVVVLRNPEELKSSFKERLNRIKIPETTIFVCVSGSNIERLDGLENFLLAFKVLEFPNPQENELVNWVEYFFKENKKRITKDASSFLAENLPCELYTVKSEIDKIITYTGEKEICEIDDVKQVFTGGREITIYRYLRALRAKQKDEIIRYAYELQSLGESGVRFIYSTGYELMKLLFVKLMRENGKTNNECAKELGISPYVVSHLAREADGFSLSELRELLDSLYSLELAFKRGEIKEPFIPTIFSARVVKEKV